MILGIDPGLATFGWARIADVAQVVDLGVLELPAKGKRKDHAGRSHRQAGALVELLAGVDLVVAEALSFPKHHAGVASLCLSWGVLLGACSARSVPVMAVRPQQWQHAAAAQDASSIDYASLVARLEEHVEQHGARAAVAALHCIAPSKRTHALDAVGVGLYGVVHRDHPLVGASVSASQPSRTTRGKHRRRAAQPPVSPQE